MAVQQKISRLVLALACTAPAALAAPLKLRLAGIENEPAQRMAAEVVRGAYARLGLDTELTWLPGERAVVAIDAGQYDADIMHPLQTAARYRNMVRVPTPVLYMDVIALSLGAGPARPSWENLQNTSVCIRRGIKFIEWRTAGFSNVSVANQYDAVILMLQKRRCDVAIVPRFAWLGMKPDGVAGVMRLDPVLERVPLYHFVHVSQAGLLPALDARLRSSQLQGVLAELQRRVDAAPLPGLGSSMLSFDASPRRPRGHGPP